MIIFNTNYVNNIYMQNTTNKKDIAWQLFMQTGNPSHYLLYNRLKQEEIDN